MSRARFSDAATRRLAERALVGDLEAREHADLAVALERSEADRVAYDALARAMCALEGGKSDLAAAQHERILAAALSVAATDSVVAATDTAADAVAAAESVVDAPVERTPTRPDRAPGAERPASRWRRLLAPRWIGALGLATAAAAAALLLLMWRRGPTPPTRPGSGGRLQTRGGSGAEGSASGRETGGKYGLEVHCVRAGRVLDTPPRRAAASADAHCGARDHLQLSLTHLVPPSGRRYPYLLVVGLGRDEGGGASRPLYYFPVPPTGRSGAARFGSDAEPLGQAVRLEVNHRPGRVRIVAVFSAKPLEASRVHAYLARLSWSQRAGRAHPLGRDVMLIQRRIVISRAAAPARAPRREDTP